MKAVIVARRVLLSTCDQASGAPWVEPGTTRCTNGTRWTTFVIRPQRDRGTALVAGWRGMRYGQVLTISRWLTHPYQTVQRRRARRRFDRADP